MRTEPEAERLVLGSIIAFPDCARDVFRQLHARDFVDPACRTVYAAMLGQHARGLAVDPPLLAAELKTNVEFRDGSAGGFMLELGENVATIANLHHTITLVREASIKRQLFAIAETARDGAQNSQPVDTTIRTLLADVEELRCGGMRGAELVRAADVEPEPVSWLWPNRIALGKVTLLAGDPGLGKSLATLAIASAVSRGAPWPDAPHDPQFAGGVVLLSAEDDLADTIRPRLDAHEADCERIFSLASLADLARDIDQLAAAIDGADGCRLVVVDPVSAYMGRADTHNNAEVRAVLTPLAQLAGEKRVAILAVTHLRKGDGVAMYRAMGSLAFVAAARAAWAVVRDKHDARRRLMLAVKNNLAADVATGLAFTIEPHGTGGAPVVCWEREPVTITADEAMAPEPKRRGPSSDEHDQAVEFLREALAVESRLAGEVIDEAVNGSGIAKRTLDRARKTLGVVAFRPENPGPWWWRLLGEAGCQADCHTSTRQTTWQSGNVPDTSGLFDEYGATNGQVAKLPSSAEGEP